MARDTDFRLALLSVHPEYARAIVDGTKTVEFRKRPLAADVTHVAVYATRPVGRVIAVFSVEEQVLDAPSRLWEMFKPVGGISHDKFFEYYDGHQQGVGIKVADLVRLAEHESLEDAFGISRPPQSVQYFDASDASAAVRLAFA
ncbi:ASCH domain-containing protein [Aeromicrobium sp. IC_218]|uniref:ASCH domain-containing protein n=1 Tax=Aeromicrobium sp. IC_218 TaxID=2545468 RepID=UPI00103EA92E|nr:ASCH domain-containing protein [Aeromicrobium sp. IC_218]TCI98929.1 ASCH domain-containing protein [Aeromicrobium sp. IC_218]